MYICIYICIYMYINIYYLMRFNVRLSRQNVASVFHVTNLSLIILSIQLQ